MEISDSTRTGTLAQLSFRVPPDRMGEFEGLYTEKVAPTLERYGLVASSERGRPAVESVFRWLFEVPTLAEVAEIREALLGDRVWRGGIERFWTGL